MEILNIRCKKMHKDATVPKYAKTGDAGLDLTAIEMIVTDDGKYIYKTGLAFEIPEGHVGYLFPRSSIRNMDLMMVNGVGVIDSGYRGPLEFTFIATDNDNPRRYSAGDRIGQLVIMPYPQINLEDVGERQLAESERGTKGHGSTGN